MAYRKVKSDKRRIESGFGIEDNIAFGTERNNIHSFGRSYLFGKNDEISQRQAFFYFIQGRAKDPYLVVPYEYDLINSVSIPKPEFRLNPNSEKIIPFECGQQLNKIRAEKYLRELNLYGKLSPFKIKANSSKVKSNDREDDDPHESELLNTTDSLAYMEELDRLLASLSIQPPSDVKGSSGMLSSDHELHSQPLEEDSTLKSDLTVEDTNNVKIPKSATSKHATKVDNVFNSMQLAPERSISLDQVNSYVHKAARKFMKYDGRADIHCCDYESDGFVRVRKNEGEDDNFNTDEFNRRLRNKRVS